MWMKRPVRAAASANMPVQSICPTLLIWIWAPPTAVRVPFSTAVPQTAVLDIENCLLCGKCEKVCPAGAIDFTQKPEEFEIDTTAIILAPAVAEARPAARLVVAGDPVRLGRERRGELESWAERLGAVHRFGYVPFADVGRYFAAADVLVMPYRHISQSGVLYLALSLGVPVVATRVGALPEMLRDGDSALLVPPESPGDLARALIRLLGDAGLRAAARPGRPAHRRRALLAVDSRADRARLRAASRASAGPQLKQALLDSRWPPSRRQIATCTVQNTAPPATILTSSENQEPVAENFLQ